MVIMVIIWNNYCLWKHKPKNKLRMLTKLISRKQETLDSEVLPISKFFSRTPNTESIFYSNKLQKASLTQITRELGKSKIIFQLAWPRYNVDRLLTFVLQEGTCKWTRNFRKPRKQTTLSQSSKHQMPKQITLSTLFPGMKGWTGSREREERGKAFSGRCVQQPKKMLPKKHCRFHLFL